ncbi:MAG: aldehyde dehydrogenase family protein, partial [Desulfobacterales bacterium]|nr:aldehyde dehydrogenase family protein [Desulfobacterales bacterium]
MLAEKDENRYFDIEVASEESPIKKLKYFVDGEFRVSKTEKYMDCFNPSTGAVIARAPQCTQAEVESAIESAKNAYPAWSETPVSKRVQVLYKFKALVDEHLEELTYLLCQEEGKNWTESMGDVLKVNEV